MECTCITQIKIYHLLPSWTRLSIHCLLDTALALPSDNFHSIFPFFLPSSCPSPTLVALIWNCHMVPSLLLIWLRKIYVIVEIYQLSLHVYLCLSSGDLLIFSVKVSSVYSYFCVNNTYLKRCNTYLRRAWKLLWNVEKWENKLKSRAFSQYSALGTTLQFVKNHYTGWKLWLLNFFFVLQQSSVFSQVGTALIFPHLFTYLI